MNQLGKGVVILVIAVLTLGGSQLGAKEGDIHVDPITNTPITVDPIKNTPITVDPITNTPITVDPIEVNPQ